MKKQQKAGKLKKRKYQTTTTSTCTNSATNTLQNIVLVTSITYLLQKFPIQPCSVLVVDAFQGPQSNIQLSHSSKLARTVPIYEINQRRVFSSFVVPNNALYATPTKRPISDTQLPLEQEEEEEEESISDVDARVLQSLLQDSKFDFQTEDGVRKLLERGTVRKRQTSTADSNAKTQQRNVGTVNVDDSEFSSTVIKKLTDTKLWQALQMKSSNVLESLGIWVANKVEQDFKVLAALGVFAWDRAVQDVARALPEAKQTIQKTSRFLLSNSSSFSLTEMELQQQRYDEANIQRRRGEGGFRPDYEIKSVTKDVLDILNGKGRLLGSASTTSSIGGPRGLRTIAPAGASNVAERQRRAFVQSQLLQRQKTDVTKVAGTVVDTAWELRRELQAERNAPGYKSEPIRKAISAAAAGTGNILRQAAVEARLAAAKRKELRALQQQQQLEQLQLRPVQEQQTSGDLTNTNNKQSKTTTIPSYPSQQQTRQQVVKVNGATTSDETAFEKLQLLFDQGQNGLDELSDRVNQCIQAPGTTWLQNAPSDSKTSTSILREVVTKMILIRNEVDAQVVQPFTITNALSRLEKLKAVQVAIDDLYNLASKKVSKDVGYNLLNYLYYGTNNPESHVTKNASLFQSFDDFGTDLEDTIKLVLQQNEEKLAETQVVNDDVGASILNVGTRGSISTSFFAQAEAMPISSNNRENSSWSSAGSGPTVELDYLTPSTYSDDEQRRKQIDQHSTATFASIPEVITVKVEVEAQPSWTNENDFDASSYYQDDTDSSFMESQQYVTAASAELISDDEYDQTISAKTKEVQPISDEQLEEEAQQRKMNIVAVAALRSLDVLFFLIEKLLTVGVPGTVVFAKTVVARLEGAQIDGTTATSKGWQTYDKLKKNARGRY